MKCGILIFAAAEPAPRQRLRLTDSGTKIPAANQLSFKPLRFRSKSYPKNPKGFGRNTRRRVTSGASSRFSCMIETRARFQGIISLPGRLSVSGRSALGRLSAALILGLTLTVLGSSCKNGRHMTIMCLRSVTSY